MLTKLTGYFYLLNSISMLVVWPVLILTNQVPELNTQFRYMVFHLIAEFCTAILGLITGIGLILNKELLKRIYFFSTGMSFTAGFLAFIFYLFLPGTMNIKLIGMLSIINIVLIILLLKNFKIFYNARNYSRSKFALLINGAQVYVLVNVAGMILDKLSGYTIGYAFVIFIFIGYSIKNSISAWRTLVSLETAQNIVQYK